MRCNATTNPFLPSVHPSVRSSFRLLVPLPSNKKLWQRHPHIHGAMLVPWLRMMVSNTRVTYQRTNQPSMRPHRSEWDWLMMVMPQLLFCRALLEPGGGVGWRWTLDENDDDDAFTIWCQMKRQKFKIKWNIAEIFLESCYLDSVFSNSSSRRRWRRRALSLWVTLAQPI